MPPFLAPFRGARAAFLGGTLAALALASTVLPAAAAEATPTEQSAAVATAVPTQVTYNPALVGRWLHQWGDCAIGCSNINQEYQFNQNTTYFFASEHRDQYNWDGRLCVDDRLYTEAGTWFTSGSLVYTTPTTAIAQHYNTCDPSNNFKKPVSLVKTYIQWQVFRESNGQLGLVLSNPLNPSQRTIYDKVG